MAGKFFNLVQINNRLKRTSKHINQTREPKCSEADHSISERFVLQKGYRMNHCHVTLNTDQYRSHTETEDDQ